MTESERRELQSLRRMQIRMLKWAEEPIKTTATLTDVISSLSNLKKYIKEGRE